MFNAVTKAIVVNEEEEEEEDLQTTSRTFSHVFCNVRILRDTFKPPGSRAGQKEDGGRWGDGRREGHGMRGVSPMETSVRKLRHPENKLASVTLRGGSELRFPAGEDLAHAYLAMPQPAPLTKAAEYGYDGRQHGASGFCTRPASVMKNECMLRKALRGLGVCQGG